MAINKCDGCKFHRPEKNYCVLLPWNYPTGEAWEKYIQWQGHQCDHQIRALQEPGEPEAGVQSNMMGFNTGVRPAGKGRASQLSLDTLIKLNDWNDSV